MRPLITLLILAIVFAASVSVSSAQAQGSAPAFELQGMVAGAYEVKYPHIAAFGPTVYLSANVDREAAAFWTKQDVAPAFGAAEHLGIAEGQPDYSTTSLAVGPDGTRYYAWVNQPTRTIFLRVQHPGQDWTPTRIVAAGQPFPVFPEVAVTTDGQVFVTWRNPDRPFLYRRSTDSGATWGPILPLSDGTAVNIADFAAGSQGQLAVAYMGAEGDRLQIYVATWDGTGFSRIRITPLHGDYADPSATYTSDGRLFVSWRGVADRGATSGVFFAERQADGSYSPARLIGGTVQGRVSIEADQAGNLHVVWNAGGKVWYSVKPSTGAWTGPVEAPAAGGAIFNVHAAISAGADGTILAHAVSEVFSGSQVSLRHYRFRSGLSAEPALSARPVLEQGARTTRSTALALAFAEVSGTPDELRYHWGSAPTDTDAWQPYASQLSVPAPALAVAHCSEQTLYTQVRAAGLLQASALSTTIQLDQAVQAEAAHASAAAPGYTNQPRLDVRITAPGECSGLATIRPVSGGVAAVPITSTPYVFSISLPDQMGRHERAVELADTLGNTAIYTVAATYDPVAPTASFDAALQIVPSETASILQTIQIHEARYSDGEGSTALPWAAAVVVSREPIDPSASNLDWTMLPLDARRVAWEPEVGAQDATVHADVVINLATLLPRTQLTPGNFYYALSLADRAGNRSASASLGQLELEQITYPTMFLPAVQR
jgi:hypothetical protein